MSVSFKPLDFDVKNPVLRSPTEEWKPHARMNENSFEWWYITSVAYDEQGRRYFILVAVWHRTGEGWFERLGAKVPEGRRLTGVFGEFNEYDAGAFNRFKDVAILGDDEIWNVDRAAIESRIGAHDIFWSYTVDGMALSMSSPNIEMDLSFDGTNEVFWHEDALGIEGLIQEGAEGDLSFYYSIPRAPMHGQVTIKNESGERKLRVTGSSWIDRQWGDFYTLDWEWTSFRFDNGARLHLYNFYNGRQEGLYIDEEGRKSIFQGVVVRQNGYAKSPETDIWVSWGWTYEFPIDVEGSRVFSVRPLSSKEFMEDVDRGFALFEGGGLLIDETTGKQVGMAVNESADIRRMKNAPYGERQR